MQKSLFTKISGFKRIVKCRACGKKMFSDKEFAYCPECEKRMHRERDD